MVAVYVVAVFTVIPAPVLRVKVFEPLIVPVVPNVTEPLAARAEFTVSVPAPLAVVPIVMFVMLALAATVTVKLASITTLSDAVGVQPQEAPPLLIDDHVPTEAQFPEALAKYVVAKLLVLNNTPKQINNAE